jgi:hypothetical protein
VCVCVCVCEKETHNHYRQQQETMSTPKRMVARAYLGDTPVLRQLGLHNTFKSIPISQVGLCVC